MSTIASRQTIAASRMNDLVTSARNCEETLRYCRRLLETDGTEADRVDLDDLLDAIRIYREARLRALGEAGRRKAA